MRTETESAAWTVLELARREAWQLAPDCGESRWPALYDAQGGKIANVYDGQEGRLDHGPAIVLAVNTIAEAREALESVAAELAGDGMPANPKRGRMLVEKARAVLARLNKE